MGSPFSATGVHGRLEQQAQLKRAARKSKRSMLPCDSPIRSAYSAMAAYTSPT